MTLVAKGTAGGGRRTVSAWVWVAVWAVAAAVGPMVGLLVGLIVLGAIPAILLGVHLGRTCAWPALAGAVGAGIVGPPLAFAWSGSLAEAADGGSVLFLALAVVGLLVYAFPLMLAAVAGAWLTVRPAGAARGPRARRQAGPPRRYGPR
ncbi:hypothetical protein ABT095_06675 [Kitasatospora sp. NPDC002227]|uniref:hypothetical protein n=1 Tax=Kitasatospora sp. NPDC002227 TaxID=3154773 RepID=UPI003331CAB1